MNKRVEKPENKDHENIICDCSNCCCYKVQDNWEAYHQQEIARLEKELARIKGISVEDITHWIDDYFHYALYKNDETFSDVWGDTFCLQEARSIAKQIHSLIQGGGK